MNILCFGLLWSIVSLLYLFILTQTTLVHSLTGYSFTFTLTGDLFILFLKDSLVCFQLFTLTMM